MRTIWTFIITFVIVTSVLIVGFELILHEEQKSAWLEFDSDLEYLQMLVNQVATNPPPASRSTELIIPEGATVNFSDNQILISKPSNHENIALDVNIHISGPPLNYGRWELTLTRNENGVEVQSKSF